MRGRRRERGREREKESKSMSWGGAENRREIQNPKQAPGSELSAHSLMRGLSPQTVTL